MGDPNRPYVHTLIRDHDSSYPRWTESGSWPVVLIYWDENNAQNYYRATVNFSNGSATVPFSNFTYVGKP